MRNAATKRMLGVVLTIVVSIVAACGVAKPTVADALPATSLGLANSSVIVGETFELDLTLSGNPGIIGATVELNYDSRLVLTGVSNGPAFSRLEMTAPGSLTSGCRIHWDAANIDDADIKDGVIAKLAFRASSDAEPGSSCFVRAVAATKGTSKDVYDRNLDEVDLQPASCSVLIEKKPAVKVGNIVLSAGSLTLGKVGQTAALSATVKPDNAEDKTLLWTSSNPSVAKVSNTGVVTAAGNGSAKITATSRDGGASASCVVTVSIEQPKPSAPVPAVSRVTMHRLYNPNSGEHFYTANAGEKNALVSVGWNYEGTGWIAPKSSAKPVYRLYNENAGDHHYTMSSGERDTLVGVGWKYEGIGWYSAESSGTPLYRQYNPNAQAGSHNYTTSKSENDALVALGWKAEGIGWYGLK